MDTLANPEPVLTPSVTPLTRKQKIAAVVLSFMGVAVFAYWFTQFQTNLYYLPYGGVDIAKLKATPVPSTTNAQPTVDLTVDTDHDGLPDYSEINTYHTSPYLADSDGDGISDYQELQNGTDPNCPEGKSCTLGGIYSIGAVTSSIAAQPDFNITAAQQATLKAAFGEKPDVAVIRQSVLSAAPNDTARAQVSKLSDSDILAMYQRMLSEIPVDAALPAGPLMTASPTTSQ